MQPQRYNYSYRISWLLVLLCNYIINDMYFTKCRMLYTYPCNSTAMGGRFYNFCFIDKETGAQGVQILLKQNIGLASQFIQAFPKLLQDPNEFFGQPNILIICQELELGALGFNPNSFSTTPHHLYPAMWSRQPPSTIDASVSWSVRWEWYLFSLLSGTGG